MNNKIRLYEFNSTPLRVATRPEPGKIYYTSHGEGYRCTGESNIDFDFNKVHDSVLLPGYFVEDLDDKALKHLFWTLTRSELERINYEFKNTSKRV